MKFKLAILFVAFLLAGFAQADQEYVCNFGDNVRLITVTYDSELDLVPCQVQYDKGHGVETLWNAQSEVGYCESKASEFVAKQESWGWSCEKLEQTAQSEEMEPTAQAEEMQPMSSDEMQSAVQ